MELTQSLEKLVKNTEKLVLQLLNTNYPFALWSTPQSDQAFLMIEVSEKGATIENQEIWTLEERPECFVINPYHQSHPPKPDMINGDIVLTLSSTSNELKLSPTLSSSDLERFIDALKETDSVTYSGTKGKLDFSKDYEKQVGDSVEKIKSGSIEKVVLSRYKEFDLPDGFNPYDLFHKLSTNYPNAFSYLLSSPEHGVWMGATPERLITVENQQTFITDALAGTQPIEKETNLADIAWTQKEIEEQAMVSRYIISCFKKIRLREYEEVGPKTVRAGNLAHLKTSYTVDMEATNTPNLGSIMLDLLHPTSAVCGFPREEAHSFIKEHENFDRELYSGFLGPVNFENATRLFVNLRCMKLEKSKARLFAGAGITADSNPEKEFKETDYKMNTLLAVLLSE